MQGQIPPIKLGIMMLANTAQLRPHHGARPGVWTCMRAYGGHVYSTKPSQTQPEEVTWDYLPAGPLP